MDKSNEIDRETTKVMTMNKQGSHRFLNIKIKEKQGDSRRNFQRFDEKFEKNKGESKRF